MSTGKLYSHDGKEQTLTQWSVGTGIPRSTLCSRITKGATMSDAITAVVKKHGSASREERVASIMGWKKIQDGDGVSGPEAAHFLSTRRMKVDRFSATVTLAEMADRGILDRVKVYNRKLKRNVWRYRKASNHTHYLRSPWRTITNEQLGLVPCQFGVAV